MGIIVNTDSEYALYDHGTISSCCVLLSAYNGAKFIKIQIDSILNQSNVDVHLFVRDDGSTDDTLDILADYERQYPDKVTVFRCSNKGIKASFTELLMKVDSCEYTAFADQDDIWDNDKLEKAIQAMRFHNADFYSCSSRLVDDNLEEMGSTTECKDKCEYYMNSDNHIFTCGVQGCTMVFSNRLHKFLVSHHYDPIFAHDNWITIVAYYFYNCIYDVSPHMGYRQHDESWTGNRKNRIRQYFKDVGFYIKGLERYSILANALLEYYPDELSPEDKDKLKAIASPSSSFFNRFKDCRKYHLGKFGWKENIGLKLYYIFSR